MGKYAFPDYRLLPQQLFKATKLSKPAKIALKSACNRIDAELQSGAGFPIDQQLREFLLEYSHRALGHGLMTMPSSFNVFEGFFEFRVNFPAHFFTIRPEVDHLFSLADFLEFVTSENGASFSVNSLFSLKDGIIYSYTPIGDFRDITFLHADSSRFVLAGFTMVRRDDQLHWSMIGGPICDLAEQTFEIKQSEDERQFGPPQKAFIKPHSSLEARAEPLVGTSDVWKTIVFGRINIRSQKHEIKGFGRDKGNGYFMYTDDPDIYGIDDLDEIGKRLEKMSEALQRERLLFEIAETCFQLPTYFAHRITLVRHTKRRRPLRPCPLCSDPRYLA